MNPNAAQPEPDLFAPRVTAPPYPDGVPVDVCDLFERLALQVRAMRFERYSARALAHRLRWHFHIEKGNREFVFNNNWSPSLARWLMKKHPDMAGFFELRESRED